MDELELKNFDKADETRQFQGNGWADFVYVGGREIARGHFEPGWRWSDNVKPIARTDLCEFPHLGYMLKGRMRITMKDGTELEVTQGDVVSIPPGHDAEVVGDEEAVFVDFSGQLTDYALSK